jgi:hypothetical protein
LKSPASLQLEADGHAHLLKYNKKPHCMKEVVMIKKRAKAVLWKKHIQKNSDSTVITTKDFYYQE